MSAAVAAVGQETGSLLGKASQSSNGGLLDGRQVTAQQLWDVADKSRHYAGLVDKQGWMNCFSKNARIQDPVGCPVHTDIGQFWDIFIAPNLIQFNDPKDYVDVETMRVLRDVTLEIALGGGPKCHQPIRVVYTMCIENGHLRIAALQAYWTALNQRMVPGESLFALMKAQGATFLHIMRLQGVWWTCKYLVGLGRGPWNIELFGTRFMSKL